MKGALWLLTEVVFVANPLACLWSKVLLILMYREQSYLQEADELLGLTEIKPIKQGSMSSRLARRLKQIERLNPKPKQQIIQLIDTFIEAERLKEQAHGNNAN